ncbi:MAG: hypothetical protein AAFQ42_13410, partial [Pseudomonadota bacterium]
LPVAVFWFLAVLVWRAQELHLMSSAMTEVAVRLAEPDRLAEQSIASLGQTVRRQVMSMNDAINRSLGRAGELEALVHSEVAALERAYHENEIRIRTLINELVSERQSLTNNSDRVSDTIRGIGNEVRKEIVAASEVAAQSLSSAAHELTQEVQRSGSQLTARIQATNDQTAHLMSESGNALLTSLGDMNKRIGVEVPTLLDKLAGEQTRLTKIVEGAGRNLAALETALGERVDGLETSLGDKTEVLRDTLQHKIKDFDDTFSDKARQLDAAIGEKMSQFDQAITSKAQTFYQTLDKAGGDIDRGMLERTRAIEATMQRHASQIEQNVQRASDTIDQSVQRGSSHLEQTVQRQTGQLEQALRHQTQQVDGTIGKGIDAVQRANENITTQSLRTLDGLSQQGESLRDISEGLLAQIRELTERFDQQGQSIMRAAHDLEATSFRIDTVLEARHAEMSGLMDDVSAQAEALDAASRSPSGARLASGANLRERYNRAAEDVERDRRMQERQSRRAAAPSAPQMPSPAGNAFAAGGDIDAMRATLRRELEQRGQHGRNEAALQEQLNTLDGGAARRQATYGASPGARSTPPSARPGGAPAQQIGGAGGERWSLGDLLSRASDDPALPVVSDAAPVTPTNATLDLKNMARAIDMGTATDIWSRLNAGERNALDRSIYTLDGRATFDEIGRRIVSDTAFRNSVNRYLMDFEQLLREVDQNDAAGDIVRSHLISDMGRVYLLLAHASGRLS